MLTDLQSSFEEIRDIPYTIPLSYDQKDHCCTGKHSLFLAVLKDGGYEARWRICSFKWSDLNLPPDLLIIPHEDNCTHAYLEVFINEQWQNIDLTWDKGLRDTLPVNEWSSFSNMTIAVPVLEIYSPEQSGSIMENPTREEFEKDIQINGDFYRAFNTWLEKERDK